MTDTKKDGGGLAAMSRDGVERLTAGPKLDRVTKAVAGAWFGMMRAGGESHLHFGLQKGRPSIESERALNILEAHGMVSREADEFGGMTYRPLVDMSVYLASANLNIKLTETLPAGRDLLASKGERS